MAFDFFNPTKGEDVVRVGPLRALRWIGASPRFSQTVLLIHGVWVGAHVWRQLAPYLARHGYTTYAVWLRHHHPGADHGRLNGVGLRDYAYDIVEAVDELNGPVLIGHSMGGIIAQMATAISNPAGLGLLSSAPPLGIPAIPRLSFLASATRHFFGDFVGRQPMGPFGDRVFHEHLHPEQRDALAGNAVFEPRRVARQLAFWPPHVRRSHVRCPVFVAGGDDDPIITPWQTRQIGRRYQVVPTLYEGRGHMPQLEPSWEVIGDDLMRWMNRFVD